MNSIRQWVYGQLLGEARMLLQSAWDSQLLRRPHLIISGFYLATSHILTWLYFTYDGIIGVRVFESQGMPPIIIIVTFAICGWVLAQKRASWVYALCTSPMIIYAFGLLLNFPQFGSPTVILAGVYLAVAGLLGLSAIRLRYEFDRYAVTIVDMERRIKQLAERIPEGISLETSKPDPVKSAQRIVQDMAHGDDN